ncbi:hypothetical protein RRF57_010616 [Xylaria bambusicola]|uniref:Uncharacterized protein n=1 Tax=Xylaria bambusicola TaxID=326684 RepID=A0AAN7V1M3_9PEZI
MSETCGNTRSSQTLDGKLATFLSILFRSKAPPLVAVKASENVNFQVVLAEVVKLLSKVAL